VERLEWNGGSQLCSEVKDPSFLTDSSIAAGTFYAKCDMASRMCIKRALFFSFLLTLLVLVRTDGPCSLLVFVVKAILRLV
jgi:hypothetical protein